MAVDPRQIVAAFLTMSMFAMLGNMIKNDHFDSPKVPEASVVRHFDGTKVEEKDVDMLPQVSQGPWRENEPELKSCWTKPTSNEEAESKGYITFSLTSGPEYHVSQVAAAVVIARYLEATLVLPDIRGSELGQKRNFEDIYDVQIFKRSLAGVIKLTQELPPDIVKTESAVVRVPSRITKDYIMKNIEPFFRAKKNLRLAVYFPSTNMKIKTKYINEMKSVGCLATFGALELKPDITEVVDSMVQRLRTLGRKSDGRFVAVDLRVDILGSKGCEQSGGSGKKSCYDAREIAEFLRKIGFDGDTTIYLTQTWWHESLDILKELFPRTYTKDDIMPQEKRDEFLQSGNTELQKAVDFYVCSQSDVFVPAISGLFYGNVAGRRIASGRTQILVPGQVTGASASPSNFISSYVSKKNHMAYSCYC